MRTGAFVEQQGTTLATLVAGQTLAAIATQGKHIVSNQQRIG